jgi:hypothetical protein
MFGASRGARGLGLLSRLRCGGLHSSYFEWRGVRLVNLPLGRDIGRAGCRAADCPGGRTTTRRAGSRSTLRACRWRSRIRRGVHTALLICRLERVCGYEQLLVLDEQGAQLAQTLVDFEANRAQQVGGHTCPSGSECSRAGYSRSGPHRASPGLSPQLDSDTRPGSQAPLNPS